MLSGRKFGEIVREREREILNWIENVLMSFTNYHASRVNSY